VRAKFVAAEGDHLTLLAVLRAYLQVCVTLEGGFWAWARVRGLSSAQQSLPGRASMASRALQQQFRRHLSSSAAIARLEHSPASNPPRSPRHAWQSRPALPPSLRRCRVSSGPCGRRTTSSTSGEGGAESSKPNPQSRPSTSKPDSNLPTSKPIIPKAQAQTDLCLGCAPPHQEPLPRQRHSSSNPEPPLITAPPQVRSEGPRHLRPIGGPPLRAGPSPPLLRRRRGPAAARAGGGAVPARGAAAGGRRIQVGPRLVGGWRFSARRRRAGAGTPPGRRPQKMPPLRSCPTRPPARARAAPPKRPRPRQTWPPRVIATGQEVFIHPSSVLCGKKPECVVFNELVGGGLFWAGVAWRGVGACLGKAPPLALHPGRCPLNPRPPRAGGVPFGGGSVWELRGSVCLGLGASSRFTDRTQPRGPARPGGAPDCPTAAADRKPGARRRAPRRGPCKDLASLSLKPCPGTSAPLPPPKKPQVRTTKQYAREVCRIEPAWLPELAPAFFAAKAGAAAGAVERRGGGG
jgi:hypothetical protein